MRLKNAYCCLSMHFFSTYTNLEESFEPTAAALHGVAGEGVQDRFVGEIKIAACRADEV